MCTALRVVTPGPRDGLHVSDSFLQGTVDVLRADIKLLRGLPLRPGHGVLDRVLEFALPDNHETSLARVDKVTERFGVRAGHPLGQVAADAADDAADRGRENDSDGSAGGDAPPGAVTRCGLVLILVHLAGGVLGDDGRIVET